MAIVDGDSLLHCLADVPRGLVPDEPEGPFALGCKVGGEPRQKSARDPADGTSLPTAHQPRVSCRHLEAITGPGFAPLGPWPGPAFPPAVRAGRRSRHAEQAGLHGSTTLHLRSRAPGPDAARPSGSGGPGGFFPLLGRLRTDNPGFGAWPTAPQADDGLQPGRTGAGGLAQARLVADGGQPFEGPHTRRLAKGAGALVQDDASLCACVGVQHGLAPQRHVRPTRHTRKTTLVKRVKDVAHRLRRTAQGLRDPCGFLPRCTREPHLAAAHGKGLTTAPPSGEGDALFVCDMADIQWWFQSAEPSTLSHTCTNTLLKRNYSGLARVARPGACG